MFGSIFSLRIKHLKLYDLFVSDFSATNKNNANEEKFILLMASEESVGSIALGLK